MLNGELTDFSFRAVDPETGLAAVRHVGIRDGSIVVVGEEPLEARLREGGRRIDATDLVVAPGFIDLHAHGLSDAAIRYRIRDGVTTAPILWATDSPRASRARTSPALTR